MSKMASESIMVKKECISRHAFCERPNCYMNISAGNKFRSWRVRMRRRVSLCSGRISY